MKKYVIVHNLYNENLEVLKETCNSLKEAEEKIQNYQEFSDFEKGNNHSIRGYKEFWKKANEDKERIYEERGDSAYTINEKKFLESIGEIE